MNVTALHPADNAFTSCLIYVSIALYPPSDVLLDIVRTCERENAAQGISGMLCYSATRYIQLLEGPGSTLERLWDNLAHDLRHRILWTVRHPPAARRIPACLPLGYASERQSREGGEAVFGPDTDNCPDMATSEGLAARLAALARQIYPSAFGMGI